MHVRAVGSFVFFLVGSVLATAGLVVSIWVGKPMRDQAVASVSWPTTEGRITRSQLASGSSRTGAGSHTADIEYEYDLDGRRLVGSRVWIGDSYTASPGHEFRAAVSRYPVGRQVSVHYDPRDPAESVLEPGTTWSGSMLLIMGLAFFAIGSLLVLSVLVPLLLVVALTASASRGAGGDMRDFDRPSFPWPPRASPPPP